MPRTPFQPSPPAAGGRLARESRAGVPESLRRFEPRPGRKPFPGEAVRPPHPDTAEGPASVEAILTRLRSRIEEVFARERVPPEDAEDLLQETLFVLIFKWESIRKPEAWLLATLRNRCLIYRRKLEESPLDTVEPKALERLAGSQAPPQERAELRHDLSVAFGRLPERYRDVLRLRYGLGCESSEIAERLGYGSESMRRLTSRCLVSLGRELQNVGITRDNVR